MNILKPISISLSPNTEKDDIFLAFKLIFQPWKWKRGEAAEKLENRFKKYFNFKYAIAFNSGRSSLTAILKSLNVEKESEVLLQAFTCNAASNPIIWSGLKSVYVDCDNNFNLDTDDLRKKITPKSRAIIVQHTFGIPANIGEIAKIAKENNLILIEDCAHSLGAKFNNQKIGTFGDVSFFSFSRDKIISSVYGGMIITNDDKLFKRIKNFQEKTSYPSFYWIKQQLIHPILMNWFILPTYRIFGKYLLILLQYIKILSKAVHWKEKKGLMPNYFPKKMPNALAILALNQFEKIEKFNNHRKEIADFYFKKLENTCFKLPEAPKNSSPVFLRFPIKHSDAHQIIKQSWKNNLLIGDWYTSPIAPEDTILEKVGYKAGFCPNAESLAKITFNLPTHINISRKEAQKVVNFLNKYLNKHPIKY